MHNQLPKIYCFVNEFDKYLIKKLNKNISVIYRNYSKKIDKNEINNLKNYCKKKGNKFLISNNIKLAIKMGLDGVYLPSFNKSININFYSKKKNFIILGSAHNLKQIRNKELQGVKAIFLSSLFKRKKTFLGMYRFRLVKKLTKLKVIALGGINLKNINKIKLLDVYGFAGISYFQKKTTPSLSGGRFKF